MMIFVFHWVVKNRITIIGNAVQLVGASKALTISNIFAGVTAINVSAMLPVDGGDVAQDAFNCASIVPEASCQLALTPGTATHTIGAKGDIYRHHDTNNTKNAPF